MEAPSKLAKVFHLGAFVIYAYTIYYSFTKVNVPPPFPEFEYAGKAKYLTQWNLCLCGVYFGLCVLLDLVPMKSLCRFRDYIFCSVSLPSCVFVTVLFWGLYAYDREVIFPRELEPYYPKWVNHCSHTVILFTAVGEALLYPHRVPSKLGGLPAILAWFGIYLAWVLYLGTARGIWVYQFMRMLSPIGLTVFFVGCCIAVFLLHFTSNALLHTRDRKTVFLIKQQKLG